MKSKLALMAGVAAIGLFCSTVALATTQTVTANIRFENAITITENQQINFGIVTTAAGAGDSYKISSAGAVTVLAGTGVSLGGTIQAGSYSIAGSAAQTINISVGNYVTNSSVAPTTAVCAYNGGAEDADCVIAGAAAPTGAGKTLLVGVTVTTTGAKAAGTTAAPTFDLTVVYT